MPPVVRFVTVGSLKEPYLREAVAEYRKRLSGLCRVEELELKEARLPDRPSEAEIRAALSREGGRDPGGDPAPVVPCCAVR